MDLARQVSSATVLAQDSAQEKVSPIFEVKRTLRVVLLREIPNDAELRQKWNALALRERVPQVFYTYEWALAVQRAYGEELKSLLFLGYDGDDLCALAALAETGGGRITFLCATTGDYCDFIGQPEHKPAFVASVLHQLEKQGRQVVLTNLPADSNTVGAVRQAARQNGYHLFAETAYECAQVNLQHLERRTGQEGVILGGAKKVRRALNALGREGKVTVDHARNWPEIQAALPEFARAHVARFLLTGRISNLARPERRVFLDELAQLLCECGWLTLSRVKVREKAIAWNYGFQFAGSWFWYQPTFDSDYEKYSPGFCLLTKIVEDAVKDPAVKIVDLGLGAEGYKEVLANQQRLTLQLSLNLSRSAHWRTMARSHLSRAARRSGSVERGLRGLVARLQNLRKRIAQAGLAPTLKFLGGRAISLVAGNDEVYFYEAPNSSAVRTTDDFALKPIDGALLADAVMRYRDDEATLSYLLRCAGRSTEQDRPGFALTNASGELLHFLWAAPFETFYCAELHSTVPSVETGSIVLFDAWTPPVHRGRGYYAETVGRAAVKMGERGQRCWIFSASTNARSTRGLEEGGFQRKFSVVRSRVLWQEKIVRTES